LDARGCRGLYWTFVHVGAPAREQRLYGRAAHANARGAAFTAPRDLAVTTLKPRAVDCSAPTARDSLLLRQDCGPRGGVCQGIKYTLCLIYKLSPVCAHAPGMAPNGSEVRAIDLADIHVLVVDDHEDTLEVFGVAMQQFGANVLKARNARHALTIMKTARLNAVVSDLTMQVRTVSSCSSTDPPAQERTRPQHPGDRGHRRIGNATPPAG